MLACWVWRDDGFTAPLGQPIPKLSGVIGAVSNKPSWYGYAFKQRGGPRQIVGLPRRHNKRQGPTDIVGYGVNFSRPSAARSADGLLKGPPFAPAAERCALMWVESTAAVPTTPLDPLRA